jgi:hypothetical protein
LQKAAAGQTRRNVTANSLHDGGSLFHEVSPRRANLDSQ